MRGALSFVFAATLSCLGVAADVSPAAFVTVLKMAAISSQ